MVYDLKQDCTACEEHAHLFLREPVYVEMWSKHLLCDLSETIFGGLANEGNRRQPLDGSNVQSIRVSADVFTYAADERLWLHRSPRLEEDHCELEADVSGILRF